ncbi:MAG TPA: hypothetical protein VGI38_00210 [Puia sp.]|jgi:hypothetical protein
MSLKLNDLSLEQVQKIVSENEMKPAFAGQNPYIASGPRYEILAGIMANGLFQVELLDKKEIEDSLQQTIKVLKEYTDAAKSKSAS